LVQFRQVRRPQWDMQVPQEVAVTYRDFAAMQHFVDRLLTLLTFHSLEI